jgi:hypothetical protein
MLHATPNLFLAGLALLGLIGFIVELLAKHAAKTAEPYLSPFDGNTERVPARIRVRQFLLWTLVAGLLAAGFTIKGEYLYSSIFYFYAVAALYAAWVYRRGRQPKLMEGIRDFPDPPSILRKP